MCNKCSTADTLYTFVTTDRGNFCVVTDPIDPRTERGRALIPGIKYITTITPVGMMYAPTVHHCTLLFVNFGPEGCCSYLSPSSDRAQAKAEHEKAAMLASTHDFKWMDSEEQRQLIYGFSADEMDEIEETL